MSYDWHRTIKYFVFGENVTNTYIASLMLKIGWACTLGFVVEVVVRKQAAPYGKLLGPSNHTSKYYIF